MQINFKTGIRALALAAISILENLFIRRINSVFVRDAITLQLQPLKESVVVLTDDVTRDDVQLNHIWRAHLQNQLPPFAEQKINDAIALIEDENLRGLLATVAVPANGLIRAVTDNDSNDVEQLKALAEAFISNPETARALIQYVFIPLLNRNIKDESTRTIVIAILEGVLLEGLKEAADRV